ncbi:MAG: hypothetical protein ABSC18_09005 [Verrucomicrobiota bacterium]|jgi:hypothetical protein
MPTLPASQRTMLGNYASLTGYGGGGISPTPSAPGPGIPFKVVQAWRQ